MMKTFRVRFLQLFSIAAILICFGGLTAAQTSTGAHAPVNAPQKQESASQNSETEVAVLKAQLATMQSFTDAIIETVYWALGSIVVVAGLLVGFGWFNANKVHERDILAIRSELSGQMSTQLAQVSQAIEAHTTERLKLITSASTDATNKALGPVTKQLSWMDDSIKELQKRIAYAAIRSDARYWESKGVNTNEFRQYSALLRVGARENDANVVSECLQKFRDLLTDGTRLHVSDITEIVSVLDSLPSEHSIQVEALRKAFLTAKT